MTGMITEETLKENAVANAKGMTVRVTDDDRARIDAAAAAAGVPTATWAARELRRAARAAQIAAYTGPDAEARAWMGDADEAAEAMMARTAAADAA